jgi:hypothetical protein
MGKPLPTNLFIALPPEQCGFVRMRHLFFSILFTIVSLFTVTTVKGQIIAETFESATWTTMSTNTQIVTNTTAVASTSGGFLVSWGSVLQTVAVAANQTITTSSAAGTRTTVTTYGPTTTGNYTWAYSEVSECTESTTRAAHSFTHSLGITSTNGYLITPKINGGICRIVFWACTSKRAQFFFGLRTNFTAPLTSIPVYPTSVWSGTSTTNTGGAVKVFSVASSSSITLTTSIAYRSQFTFSVPGTATSIYTNPAQFAIIAYGGSGKVYIDDIEIHSPPTITLGSIANICPSSASQTANLPYTATSENPTRYSISGWSGGSFSTVTNASLPASPISITIPAATSAGTYTANLTVNDGTYTSVTYPISLTVTGTPATISLFSAAGTDAQVECNVSSTITNIVYTVGGSGTGATINWTPGGATPPTGISNSYSSGKYTISGSPTVAGVYSYVVSTSGSVSPCTSVTAGGTLSVYGGDTCKLSSAGGTDAQSACNLSSTINSIKYYIGGAATGAGIVWTPGGATPPTGISNSYNAGTKTYTISGSPTVAGIYSYTVTTTGGTCTAGSANGTLSVFNSGGGDTCKLSSGAGTDSQTVCTLSSTITNIVYDIGGAATGATIVWTPGGATPPTGISNSYNAAATNYTISGSPAVAGTYTYVLTTTGGTCAPTTVNGTINVYSGDTWLGTTSTNWSTASNWSCGVPTSTTNVVIQNVTNKPLLTSNDTVNNITLNTGATLNLNSQTLTINGAVSGSGQLIATNSVSMGSLVMGSSSSGTLKFGAAANYLSGLTLNTGAIILLDSATVNLELTNLTLNVSSTLNLNSNTLIIDGAISGTGKLVASNASSPASLTMGTTATGTLRFSTTPGYLAALTLKDGASISLGSSTEIVSTGTLTIGSSTGATLTTNSRLILQSDDDGSARVTQVPVNGSGVSLSTISGSVNVLCYIHSNNSDVSEARRGWRLLTAPITEFGLGTPCTIYSAWQNGGVNVSGQGTMITSPSALATGGAGNGMDAGINSNYSMYTWNVSTQQLVSVTNTKVPISNSTATAANLSYLIFIRGDRTPNTVNLPWFATINNTTLTCTGPLQLGNQIFSSVTTPTIMSGTAGAYSMVGNPYACSIDFSKVAGDIGGGTPAPYSGLANIVNRFYIWNSNLTGSQGVGGYICIDDAAYSGTYLTTLDSLKGDTLGIASPNDLSIQSGQAFFVQTVSPNATGKDSITFKEATKNSIDNFIYRPAGEQVVTAAPTSTFAAKLSLLNTDGSTISTDGIVAQFNDHYCSCIDYLDAPKFSNVDEMFSLTREGKQLCIERRADITKADTLFLTLQKMSQRSYQFKFATALANHPGIGAHLEDSYTGIHTPLHMSGSNTVDFTIDGNADSKASNRFMVVFGAVNITPLYTYIKAKREGNTIPVEWLVSNDSSIITYALQRSTNGVDYTTLHTTTAQHNGNGYTWLDADPAAGINYYRIISTNILNEQSYSSVVSVSMPTINVSGITVYPNPIQNQRIGISMNNMPTGAYRYNLLNDLGQQIQSGNFTHPGGNATTSILINTPISKGTYRLEIFDPNNISSTLTVVY